MPTIKISKSTISKVQAADRDILYWDVNMKGFGLKVTPKGKKTYICQYRVIGQKNAKRFTIGTHGIFTPDQARSEARRLLGLVANGKDPADEKNAKKKELTIAQLCDQYLHEGCATKKASTIATDKGRIERHIKPLLGRKKVSEVNRSDIKKFLGDVAKGKTSTDIKTKKYGRARVTGGEGTATRTTGLLGGIFSYAIDLGLIQRNPVRGVKRFPDKKNNRFLSIEELDRLSKALNNMEKSGVNKAGLTIIRLLLLTGARKGEIESLKWGEIDFAQEMLRLEDSKTGQKILPLNKGAIGLLRYCPKVDGTKYVFPAESGNSYYVGVSKIWRKAREQAGILDVRIHDLRHTFASYAVSAGASLPVIGVLLGHKDSATTQRYAHLSDDPVRQMSDTVSKQLDYALNDGFK